MKILSTVRKSPARYRAFDGRYVQPHYHKRTKDPEIPYTINITASQLLYTLFPADSD